jgi:hypothetical protein
MISTTPFLPQFPIQTVYNLNISPCSNGCKVIFINDTSLNCNIMFAGRQTAYWPANDRRLFEFVDQMAQPNFNIVVTALQLVPPTNFKNRFVFEIYQPGECIVETYPMPLIRGMVLVPST